MLAYFERNEVAITSGAEFVVCRDRYITPLTREIVGADEQQGLIVGDVELECAGIGSNN